jgi:hypothetical protein
VQVPRTTTVDLFAPRNTSSAQNAHCLQDRTVYGKTAGTFSDTCGFVFVFTDELRLPLRDRSKITLYFDMCFASKIT